MRISIAAGAALLGEDLLAGPGNLEIEGTTIAAAGDETTGAPCSIEAPGLLLLPGFIDTHVHIGFASPTQVLRGGVTTVRDLGWPPAEIFPLARASRDAAFDGPAILAVGPIHTCPGGYPTRAAWAPPGTGREVSTPGEARAAVAEVAGAGAAAVKVALNEAAGPTLSLALLRALVDAAHDAGLRVTAHITGLAELVKALDAGVDEMAHVLMSAEAIPQEVAARVAGEGMAVVPTLSCRFDDAGIAIDNLARLLAAGARVVYGTDLGNEGPRPGIDPREMAMMALAGMDGHAIVRAATVDAAAWLGLEATGFLATGAAADIIGVPLDALEAPVLLSDVRLVIRAGRIVREP